MLNIEYVNMMNWAAGIFDGEGSVSIGHACRTWKDRKYLSLCPVFQMQNTNKLIVDTFAKELNMEVKIWKPKIPNRKLAWFVRAQSLNECIRVAEMVEPYLIGKREQMQKFIKFCKMRLNTINSSDRNLRKASYTEEELKLSEEINRYNCRQRRNLDSIPFYQELKKRNFESRLPNNQRTY